MSKAFDADPHRAQNLMIGACPGQGLARATEQQGAVAMPEGEFPGYVPLGPKPYLDRLMREYRLSEADLRGKLRSRANRSWIGDESFDREYLVHRSVLRSRGEFRCAGDAEARAFCAKVADAMVAARGITRDEAVARINRHWATVWIVGLDLAYHRDPEGWADHIYRHTH